MDLVEPIHQIVGYPLAFIVAPLALLTYGGARGHRFYGYLFVGLMIFLYLTGLFMTLTRHEWGTWEMYRNISFNFFGFSLLLYGYRAVYLYRHPKVRVPAKLDWFLAGLLTVTVVCVLAVAIDRNTAMRVFALAGILLLVLEWRDLNKGFQPRSILFDRHVRYILGAYFYVLTVASIVHLGAEFSRNAKWLWPTFFGGVVIWLMCSRITILRRYRKYVLKFSIYSILTVALTFGIYTMWELWSGAHRINFVSHITSKMSSN